MNKDLIEFYQEEQRRIEKEIEELREVGKNSPKRENRIIEIDYILTGLNADSIIAKLRKENRDLRYRLNVEGIDLGE